MRNVRYYKVRMVAVCGLVLSTAIASARSVEPASAEALYAGFTDPASQYGPRTWWHWINERVSTDGITQDLEAMKTMGYKGAHMINLPSIQTEWTIGDDVSGTDIWYEKVGFAAKECER
ncbi:MAG: glycosyl hydrolase, partial [Opitutae bacterium]|nr:glycosyl hydrolase [Opitutae bacterium]